jgi:hypothetical protein
MNLFILSLLQKQIAEWMFDSHIVKIILEAVQVLSTAKRLVDPDDPNLAEMQIYKIAHKNHPVTIWVRQSQQNYIWTLILVYEMHKEWRYRFGHTKEEYHKSFLVAGQLLKHMPSADKFPQQGLTPFAQAMPEEYKVQGDPVKAYQQYYMSPQKSHLLKWTKRERPEFFSNCTCGR